MMPAVRVAILPRIWLQLHSDLWSVSKNHCWDASVSKTLTLAALTLLPLLQDAYHSDHVWPTLSCCPTVFTKTAVRAVRVGFWHDHIESHKFPITFKRYWSWAVGASKAMPLSEPCPRTSQLARVPSGSWHLWERMNKGNVMNHWVPVALCSRPKLANASSVRNQIYTQQMYADEDLSNHYFKRVDTTCNVCQRNAPQFNYIQTQKNQTYTLAATNIHKHVPRTQEPFGQSFIYLAWSRK